jgi:hypothetical protein
LLWLKRKHVYCSYIVNHTSVVQLRRLAITLINRHECDLLNTSGGHAPMPKLVGRLREKLGGKRVRREKCGHLRVGFVILTYI